MTHYKDQPATVTHTTKRKRKYPGLEHLTTENTINEYMSKNDMATRILKLLGIHSEEQPLKKHILKKGHTETEDTKAHIKEIKKLTLQATKQAFERDRQYRWKQYRQHSQPKNEN